MISADPPALRAQALMVVCLGFAQSLRSCAADDAAVVDEGDLGALVVDVDPAEFTGENAETLMRDLTWLGPRVARHDALVREAFARGAVVPCRFGTLLSSADAAREMLRRKGDALRAQLRSMADAGEWTVKVSGDVDALRDRIASERVAASGKSGGAAYLLAQRAKREAGPEAMQALRAHASGIAGALTTLGAARVSPARTETARADGRTPLAKVACLVEGRSGAGFARAAGAFAELMAGEGVLIEVDGPLPLYSFCEGV